MKKITKRIRLFDGAVTKDLCHCEPFVGVLGQPHFTLPTIGTTDCDTVRAHIKNIYRKLHVNSRATVVKKALRDRFI